MSGLYVIVLMFFSNYVCAETIRDKVFSVEDGIIKFSNGRVGFLQNKMERPVRNQFIEAHLSDDSTILSFTVQDQRPVEKRRENFLIEPPAFEPSLLTPVQAQEYFERLDPNYKRVSECSDRAHIWAWDEFKNNGIRSEKVFIFFTASYINRHHFKWWFHVAPLLTVNVGDGKTQKFVADFRYSHKAVPLKEWTDSLVYSKRDCRPTTKFSEYDVNPQTEDCYLMIDSMYYRLPSDLKAQEEEGKFKIRFNEFEVKSSRNWAFETKKEIFP